MESAATAKVECIFTRNAEPERVPSVYFDAARALGPPASTQPLFAAMHSRFLVTSFVAVVTAGALAAQSPEQENDVLLLQARAMFQPIPEVPPEIEDNTASPERVELGRMLFFDPRLSRSGTISCNTCHNLSMGGDDNLPTSIGHGWQKGPRNSPTVYNAVFNVAQFWDGRAADLKEQAKGPIQASVEMANEPEMVVRTLASIPDYVERFRAAFPGEQEPISFDNVTRAIEVFEATLLTPGSRFDQYLAGNQSALEPVELRGLSHFISKGCVACHNGVNIGGAGYFPFGVVEAPADEVRPPEDRGRFSVTNTEADQYVFRASSLRNVAETAPYFHSGQVWDLAEAVAIMGSSQLGTTLSDTETAEIVAFLRTLTGKAPEVTLPALPAETTDTPRPQL